MTKGVVVVSAALLVLGGCSSEWRDAAPVPSSPTPTSTGTPVPASAYEWPSGTSPSAGPEEASYTEGEVGVTEEFFADESDASTFEVTVGTPVQGKCTHPSTGCHKPETGDIVQTFPITIRNTGPDVLTIGFGSCVLEYEDGTRLVTTDGSTSDYTSVTALDFEQTLLAFARCSVAARAQRCWPPPEPMTPALTAFATASASDCVKVPSLTA